MSQENVDVVLRMVEAYQHADFETLAAGCDEDFEFTSVLTAVEETSYRGKDVWRAYWADMQETWVNWRVEVVEAVDGHDDAVVVMTRLVGEGKSSGVPVDRTIGTASCGGCARISILPTPWKPQVPRSSYPTLV
jgi:ketosteroid isomerase-like protein